MVEKKKELPNLGEFRVMAEGADVIHRWLKLQVTVDKTLTSQGLLPQDNRQYLLLGNLPTTDLALNGLRTGIVYDSRDGEYEFASQFVIKTDFIPEPLSFSNLMLEAMKPRESGKSLISLFQMTQELEEKLKGKFDVLYDKVNNEITIVSSQNGNQDLVVLRKQDDFRGEAYGLYLSSLANEDFPIFEAKYQNYALILEEVTKSFYQALDNFPPNKTFVLNPPKNTGYQIDKMEETILATKRRLTVSGLSDEGLEEEVRNKIILEKKPAVSFDDIGGLEGAKEELKTVISALKNPDLFTDWGTSAPKGVLLYGPPGTGKTLLAKALAHEADASIYVVRIADVLNSLYGRTEKLVQAVFDEAKKDGSVIIFIDELDALAAQRDHSTEVTSRIVTVLLTNLDGLDERNENIVVVGATNRLQAIDTALLRPKRFDLLIKVNLPDKVTRKKIFEIHSGRARKKAAGKTLFEVNLDYNGFVEKTEGFSGADIEELIRRALVKKVRQQAKGETPGLVTTQEILDEIAGYETIRQDRKIGF